MYFVSDLPLYDDDTDHEDSQANDERQTNHNGNRQFCQHSNHSKLRLGSSSSVLFYTIITMSWPMYYVLPNLIFAAQNYA